MGLEAVYARVVVEVAHRRVDRPFDYLVPPDLEQGVRVGNRVLVPFGSRRVGGYVVELVSQPAVSQTRSICEVLSAEPAFDREVIHLAGWMSETYLCPFVTALKCMLPAGMWGAGKRAWRWTGGDGAETDELLRHLGLSDATAAAVAGKLRSAGKIADKALRHRFAGEDIDDALALLLQHGLAANDTIYAGSAGSKKKKKIAEQTGTLLLDTSESASIQPPELSPAQAGVLAVVLASIRESQTATVLLHGVTGSGKTEVYLRAIQELIAMDRQAIVLVPEISLTPQTVGRFCARFGDRVAVLHSGLSVGQRYDAWQRIRRGTVSVVVGARSAVFAPFQRLGMIVLDEEHEPSYQQEKSPKYHAREVAQARAAYHRAVVLLASATPSLESYHLACRGTYRLLGMPTRVAARPMPPVEIVDMRLELQSGNRSIFSRALREGMRDCLAEGRQAILFLNRRGYAGFIVCRDCGNVLKCAHCDVSLTYHQAGQSLRCHTCGYRRSVPANCPACGSRRIRGFATGTEQVQREVEKLFPTARVIRMDADTTGHKGAHDVILQSFTSGDADVLVGTQMVAKGLDFPNVTLVGVISADITLNLPDFRSRERTFQLLTQVAGRSGRGDEPGRVVIQTYAPENESVLAARDHNYAGFFAAEIENRRRFNYPPFAHLVRVVVSGVREDLVQAAAHTLCRQLRGDAGTEIVPGGSDLEILGPAPAPVSRVKDSYRWLITVKGPQLAALLDLVRRETDRFLREPQAREVVVGLDVDPLGIL